MTSKRNPLLGKPKQVATKNQVPGAGYRQKFGGTLNNAQDNRLEQLKK
ncbi:MAG: hypothetical protein JKP90_11950 [Desulfofustis sp. PB-SRB1]|nr:hypothetical protein [Desulfofustis sp. PB-SRB1]